MSLSVRLHAATALAVLLAGTSPSAQAASATLETPNIASPGDADDPAFWLDPGDAARSLVIATAKNSGLRVYNLAGQELQSYLTPGKVDNVASRLNNVDVQYGFKLADGSRADLAVFTDRGQDTLRIFRIDGSASTPLTEITQYSRLFPSQPITNQATGYGLTLWRDAAADKLYALVAQRGGSAAGDLKGHSVAQFELVAQANGTVGTQLVRTWNLPTSFQGQSLTSGDFSPQSEGMVVDQQTGMLYVGQEDVGVWGIDLRSGSLGSQPLALTSTFNAGSPLTADVEGLAIRYGANGSGVILASSQGDSTFAAFDRKTFAYLGSFTVGGGTTDAVEHSDGADVTSFALPGYAEGLFVTQDGENRNAAGQLQGTNFKYVSWSDIVQANAFLAPYAQVAAGFDPRTVGAVPEPASAVLLALGLGLVGRRALRRPRA